MILVNVDIDLDLYRDIKQAVKENKVVYPSIRHFVHSTLLDKIAEIKKEKSLKKIFKRKICA